MLLFLIAFVIWNWNNIFWLFNYRIIAEKLTKKSLPEPEVVAKVKEGSLAIPKLGIEAPIVFATSTDEKDLKKYLDKGVLHYPGSALPGEQGRVIILGHSAPPGWPEINFDKVFSDINKLESGDEVYVYFDNQGYLYRVREKIFLGKGEEIPASDLTNSESVLVLISCWPPGKDYKRIAVKCLLQERER